MSLLNEVGTESRLNELPAPSVLWLLLSPALGGVLVLLSHGPQSSEGEGRELFNSNDGDVVDSTLGPGCLEVIVNLTSAVDDLANLVISNEVSAHIIDGSLEAEAGFEVLKL